MSKGAYPLKLPMTLKREAQRLAEQDGVSLNAWITVAIARRVGASETAAEFFKRRAAGPSEDLLAILRKAPNVPPMPGDEMPGDLK